MVQKISLMMGMMVFFGLSGTAIGDTSFFLNVKSFFLVIGGTFIAVAMAFPRKTINFIVSMLPDTLCEVASYSDIQCAVPLVRENVHSGLIGHP